MKKMKEEISLDRNEDEPDDEKIMKRKDIEEKARRRTRGPYRKSSILPEIKKKKN